MANEKAVKLETAPSFAVLAPAIALVLPLISAFALMVANPTITIESPWVQAGFAVACTGIIGFFISAITAVEGATAEKWETLLFCQIGMAFIAFGAALIGAPNMTAGSVTALFAGFAMIVSALIKYAVRSR